MSKYTVKIIPENPEDIPEGENCSIECEGLLLVTFEKNEKAATKTMAGCSIEMVAHAIGNDADLRAAAAIAEGYEKADKIMEESRRECGMRGLLNALKAVHDHAPEE